MIDARMTVGAARMEVYFMSRGTRESLRSGHAHLPNVEGARRSKS